MLYVTTRNDRDVFFAGRAIEEGRGPCGGLFLPAQFDGYRQKEIDRLLNLTFDQCVAEVLNQLLDADLTGWDITFYAGKKPVRLKILGYHMLVAECWHNPEWCFERMVRNLSKLVSESGDVPSPWFGIAVRIAVFAGICGELRRSGYEKTVDIAVVSGDFLSPAAAWYARKMGFPIGNIICCCNENGNIWDLIANGQMRTDGISIPSRIPGADVVLPFGLEYFVHACGGVEEVRTYLEACSLGKLYVPADTALNVMRQGVYVSVVGNCRMMQTIPGVYASRNYLLSPYDALCYCGIQDCRARHGETGPVFLFSERSPLIESSVVAEAMDVSEEVLKQYL